MARQYDATVRHRPSHQRGRWAARLAMCVAAFVASALASLDSLYAGCHYGDGRNFTSSIDPSNPHGHARNFRFLGQWIYEGGEIKYVPWQGAPPCQGPNCRADDDRSLSTSSPTNTLKRISPVTLAIGWQAANRFDGFPGCIRGSNLFPISGYPHEYEYPP